MKKEFYLVDVGHELFAARTKSQLTQKQLAKKMKTPQLVISRIEHGDRFPSFDFLIRAAKAMKMEILPPKFIPPKK